VIAAARVHRDHAERPKRVRQVWPVGAMAHAPFPPPAEFTHAQCTDGPPSGTHSSVAPVARSGNPATAIRFPRTS